MAAIGADVGWVVGALVVIVIPASMNGSGKWILTGVSAVVGLFAVLQVMGLVRASHANPTILTTEVVIEADPAAVWRVLTDLPRYHEWNPFIRKGSGEITVGQTLDLVMKPPDGRAMAFAPTVTEAIAGSTLEWLGQLVRPGVFDGRHRFHLEPTGSGTRLIQSETFTGLLVPTLARYLDIKTRAGFQEMNEAIKTRVEASLRSSS